MPDPRLRRSKHGAPRGRRPSPDAPDALAPPDASDAPDSLAPSEAASAEAEAAAEAAASVSEVEAQAVPDAGLAGGADGWFRDAPLDEGAAAAGAPVDAEPEPEPEPETIVRERDRPVVTAIPGPVSPVAGRRGRRLRGLVLGLVTIVAVAAAGFGAGLLLPSLLPGPGIWPGSPAPGPATPAPTPPDGSLPTPTVTPGTTPTPAPTAAPAATPAPTATVYVVQPGDTLQWIADRHGVTLAAIQEANQIANPNLIRVGQRLTIPLPEATPVP
ncbi:MAG TPA: LysM domain-containing protein [Patescibacteria group bacterium]|nr:LysM domain-containing protein [Patescibacteria group bacterium]